MKNEEIPYFCWDRRWTSADIKRKLASASPDEWSRLAAWIMREAKFSDVWFYLSPGQVYQRFAELERYLRGSAGFWAYILRTWHELGKV